MSIYLKTFIVLILSLILTTLTLSYFSKDIVLNSFVELENYYSERNLQRITHFIESDVKALDTITLDWGGWDDAYQFVQDKNKEFIRSNLVDGTFETTGLNFILFYDKEKQLVKGKYYDQEQSQSINIPNALLQTIVKSPLLNHAETTSFYRGIVLAQQTPYLISSRPIITSDKKGPIQGALLMGYKIDQNYIDILSEKSLSNIKLELYNREDLPSELNQIKHSLFSEKPTLIKPFSEEKLCCFSIINDIEEEPIFILQADMPREIYQAGLKAFKYLIFSIFVVSILFCSLTLFLIHKFILSRISFLRSKVSEIGKSGNIKDKVSLPGKDEVSNLASEINKMLFKIDHSKQEITKTHNLVEEERIKSNKFKSLGVLASGLAHDFNNILTSIMTNITLAKLLGPTEPTWKERLDEAENACRQSKHLTQELLTFSKGSTPIKKVISLEDLIESTANLCLRGSNVSLNLTSNEDQLSIEADASQIGQVISNLVINAQQSMPNGGNISIECQQVSDTERKELEYLKPTQNYVKITIQDTGIGIPKEIIDKIFDPYFTTKQKGSGLGLATSFFIIKKHDGFIDVDSTPGLGTTFTLYLPSTTKKRLKKDTSSLKLVHGKGHILIMDDDEEILRSLAILLNRLGFQVNTAKNGDEAIAQYKKAFLQKNPYELVILDLTIQGGKGGKETVKELLKIDPKANVIVTSGYSTDAVFSEYENYGFKGIMPKPYSLEEINTVLNKTMHQSRAA